MSFKDPHSFRAFSLRYNAPFIQHEIPLLGVFDEAGLTLIGDSLDFGDHDPGESEEITLRLVNIGGSFLRLFDIDVSGTGFELVSGPDKVILAADEFTFITIRAAEPDVASGSS